MKLVVSTRSDGGERTEEATVEAHSGGWRVTVGERSYEVDATHKGVLRSLIVDGKQYEVAAHPLADDRYRVSTYRGLREVTVMDPLAYLAEQAHGAQGAKKKVVTAYMPGVVKKVLVEEGQVVARGESLAVLEAMKMENEIEAEADGTIEKVLVEEGQAVDGGEALFEVG